MPNVNESQLPIQILGENKPRVNESQLPIQVLGGNRPDVQVSQLVVQVLLSVPRQQPRIYISS
jgi:hypothetical protein